MIAYLSQVLPRPWSSTFHSPVPSQPTYVSCDLGSRQRIRHRNEHHGMLMPQLRLGQTICYSCSHQGDKRATRANQSHCLQEDTDLPVVGAQARNGRQSDHNRQTRRNRGQKLLPYGSIKRRISTGRWESQDWSAKMTYGAIPARYGPLLPALSPRRVYAWS